jgi:hypothetical protein
MAQSIQPGRFGQSGKPNDAWLAKQEKEQILEPDLPIIDTHHHLWDRGGWTYLLPELLADLDIGHNIVGTVFEECRSMYRADGWVERTFSWFGRNRRLAKVSRTSPGPRHLRHPRFDPACPQAACRAQAMTSTTRVGMVAPVPLPTASVCCRKKSADFAGA